MSVILKKEGTLLIITRVKYKLPYGVEIVALKLP